MNKTKEFDSIPKQLANIDSCNIEKKRESNNLFAYKECKRKTNMESNRYSIQKECLTNKTI